MTRDAWCSKCDGVRAADRNGCLACSGLTCEECSGVARVLVTVTVIGADRQQTERRICVPCWSGK